MIRKTYEDFLKEAIEYENIVKNYSSTHEKYIDPNFHPTLHIKEYGEKLHVNDSIESYIRLEEEYKSPLFKKENISPKYIHQGSLGDCYLLSSIGRLCMQPSLIPNLFETEIPNKYLGEVENSINLDCGAVVIYFWWFGRKTPVLIDTLMPTINGKLQFSSPIDKTKSAFFCLIEKAFAKLNGSYSNIIKGNISVAIHSMFGNYYPVYKSINDLKVSAAKSNSTVFDQIMKYQNQKLAVIETLIDMDDSNVTEQELKNKNLHSNHSYLIMKVRKVKALNGLILICLQNPWGHSEWNGDFSDYSSCWTPEAKKELKLEEKDDGTFWMKEEDYVKYFTGIHLTRAITNKMQLRSFDCQFLPESRKCRKNNSNLNVAFQFVDDIQDGEKCNFYILVEKCHDFYDEKGTYCKYMKYQINLTHKIGKIIKSIQTQNSTNNLVRFKDKASKNETVIISFEKLERPDITEDCYISVFSEYKFKLYNYDNPSQVYLLSDIPNKGCVFAPISYGNIDEQFPIIQEFVQSRYKTTEITMNDVNALIEVFLGIIVADSNKEKNNPNSYNYKIECEELMTKINNIQNENIQKAKDLQKENEDLLRTIDKMKKEKEELSTLIDKTKKEKEELITLVDKMKINLKNEKKMHFDKSKYDLIEINQLYQQNQDLIRDLNSISNELNQIRKESDNLFINHQKTKNENKNLLKKNDLLSNQLKQKDKENIMIKNENENMKKQLNKLKNEIEHCRNVFDVNENDDESETYILTIDEHSDSGLKNSESNMNYSENVIKPQTVVPQITFNVVKPKMKSSESYNRFKKFNK